MRFLVVGCSFRTARLSVRESLAYSAGELPAALRELLALEPVHEVVLLSTCNRVEIWTVASSVQHAERLIHEFLARDRGVERDVLDPILYDHIDREALAHIFRVTASLDAMVVGEAQIGGQVKDAYAAARDGRTLGSLLNRCMHKAFSTSKRIRTETHISRHAVSISSVAVELATRVFGELASRAILIVGAGEMAELTLQHLVASGVTRMRITNRTAAHARELAVQVGATAVPFEGLDRHLELADIVITSTGSAEPIFTRKLMSSVMRRRKQRPLFIIDIAVPKDVEEKVARMSNVYLFDIDDLEQVAADNLEARRLEAREAEAIVERDVARFEAWVMQQVAVPVVKALRSHFTEIARAEAAKTAHSLHLEREEDRRALDAMAGAIVNKLLHHPTVALKEHAARPDGSILSHAARQLFQLTESSCDVEEEARGPQEKKR